MTFITLEDMIVATAEAVRPPERLSISEGARRTHYVNLPGTHVGYFDYDKTPYLIEPQDELSSLQFTGQIYVGPARGGKSAGAINWLASSARYDPADMMFIHMTQATARDWSIGDLGRAIRYSPEIARRMTPGRQNDNVFDKRFLSGMRLLIKWPTITELSGKTIPRLWLFDYDRMPQDIDGEGNPFDLARKRAQTFKRFGMCAAEGSPGFIIEDPKWLPSTPHEAPPTKGILSLYNRGDRRRWYWRCVKCREPFEGDFKNFVWPDSADLLDAAEQVRLLCPSCEFPHEHEMKYELNLGGKWIKEGQVWLPDGTVGGVARRSTIASFWQKGPSAAFATWTELVFKFLQAQQEYEATGSEEALKTTTNVDQGLPYMMKATEAGRLPEELKQRAEDWGGSAEAPVVPHGGRFLVKTVDVQARAFVVQTHSVDEYGDIAIIEMKKIRRSVVADENGEWQTIDPASRPEDWDVLIEELHQTYPLADGSGMRMRIKIMGCDSGGREGVTANAYNFWRKLRDRGDGEHLRFHLIKGDASKSAPRISTIYPDSGRKDRFVNARGEIPVQRVNTDIVKDMAYAMLGRTDPGGRVRFPLWAEEWLYKQLTTEIKTAKGWENLSRRRNEAWDLLVYTIALCLHRTVNLERIDWDNPPTWARDWDENDMVFNPYVEDDDSAPDTAPSLADLASRLA
ncbi:phage terminase large subunit family protein [Sphingopyxis sp. GW247-27LB]|uniref:phage terminase large subunit family protein n=1 Tax=Sphingopyxis sp. GW247-27LB TaxID=2012632 RepID=UPI000BA618C3|nr:terminase gpA endonuclease subunit [Sphingopyxis sp. GW247-27LB]PAL23527.1 hypothetical protein CD928_05525 [Sphingopyxis sp. GW247-27LB]